MKKFLRQQKLAERLAHHPKIKWSKDLKICQKLFELEEVKQAQTILFYLPIHGEVDLRPLYRRLRLYKKFVLCRVIPSEKNLELRIIKNLKTDVEKGSFGVLEPKKSTPKIEPKEIDMVLVPGVVFSEDGHRIGFGMGFYDRLLKKIKGVKIGVAYDFQIVKNSAGEKHDVKMEIIVTEEKILRV